MYRFLTWYSDYSYISRAYEDVLPDMDIANIVRITSFSGPDIGIHHDLVIMILCLHLKKMKRLGYARA